MVTQNAPVAETSLVEGVVISRRWNEDDTGSNSAENSLLQCFGEGPGMGLEKGISKISPLPVDECQTFHSAMEWTWAALT